MKQRPEMVPIVRLRRPWSAGSAVRISRWPSRSRQAWIICRSRHENKKGMSREGQRSLREWHCHVCYHAFKWMCSTHAKQTQTKLSKHPQTCTFDVLKTRGYFCVCVCVRLRIISLLLLCFRYTGYVVGISVLVHLSHRLYHGFPKPRVFSFRAVTLF